MHSTMRHISGLLLLVASAATQAAGPRAVETVSALYHDFAWEAVMARPTRPGLAQQPKAVLRRYFTPALASALAADAACAARRREICALDFAPLWASQDPAAQDLSITPGTGGNQVQVRFRAPSAQEWLVLTFQLAPTAAGWRVADISYPSGPSLAKLLAESPE